MVSICRAALMGEVFQHPTDHAQLLITEGFGLQAIIRAGVEFLRKLPPLYTEPAYFLNGQPDGTSSHRRTSVEIDDADHGRSAPQRCRASGTSANADAWHEP